MILIQTKTKITLLIWGKIYSSVTREIQLNIYYNYKKCIHYYLYLNNDACAVKMTIKHSRVRNRIRVINLIEMSTRDHWLIVKKHRLSQTTHTHTCFIYCLCASGLCTCDKTDPKDEIRFKVWLRLYTYIYDSGESTNSTDVGIRDAWIPRSASTTESNYVQRESVNCIKAFGIRITCGIHVCTSHATDPKQFVNYKLLLSLSLLLLSLLIIVIVVIMLEVKLNSARGWQTSCCGFTVRWIGLKVHFNLW